MVGRLNKTVDEFLAKVPMEERDARSIRIIYWICADKVKKFEQIAATIEDANIKAEFLAEFAEDTTETRAIMRRCEEEITRRQLTIK